MHRVEISFNAFDSIESYSFSFLPPSKMVREDGVEPPKPFGHRFTAGYPHHVVSVPGYLRC